MQKVPSASELFQVELADKPHMDHRLDVISADVVRMPPLVIDPVPWAVLLTSRGADQKHWSFFLLHSSSLVSFVGPREVPWLTALIIACKVQCEPWDDMHILSPPSFRRATTTTTTARETLPKSKS